MPPKRKKRTAQANLDEDETDEDDVRPTKRLGNARNPSGKNQYVAVPPVDEVADVIRKYHSDNPTFKYADYIEALLTDHNIKIGRSKIAKYLTQLGLSTSSRGNRMPDDEQTQLILDELGNDPHQTRGPRVVKEALNLAGHKIGRNKISDVMHTFEEEGFEKRDPKAQKKTVNRTPLTAVGPHEEWSMDGHDKMNEAGFGIYGIRDKWGTKFLHYRVLPSNRFADVIGVVFLECAKKYGGIPIQGSSDHGSEVRDAHAAQKTLREQFWDDENADGIPAWMFLESTHNITVESGWRPLFYTWGINVLEFYSAGMNDIFFKPANYIHQQTCNWIWFPLVQRSLDEFCHRQNNHRIRKQKDKLLPSGGTPNAFTANPAKYGGHNCLIKIPADAIDKFLDEARETAREHMRYVDDDFDELACDAYEALQKPVITLQTAWVVFRAMVEQLNRM
ncbi:hypothetical protein R3P38DRAFT_2861331 [Favolaschia claudopus]|uniref:Integrase core domain-containing protein n=1 Tax=Favolaschia claudopus TaxID=2862362 RepID=A0AAW0DM06_9AGAR